MARFQDLQDRIDAGDVIILDGAIGTQLQELGVPIAPTAWAAAALQTHPYTVRYVHETYIEAGADIITTNTYSSARHCLEPAGMGDLTRELNLRAVVLAKEARDRAAHDRPVFIAGSVSNFGMITGGEPLPGRLAEARSAYTAEQTKENLREQAEILTDAGVDFLLVESTGSIEHRKWVLEACLSTGAPTWVGFRCRLDDGAVKGGFEEDVSFAEGLDAVVPLGGSLVSVFHSTVEATTAGVPIVKQKWSGPIGVYPDADRHDYVNRHQDTSTRNRTSPDEFVELARQWVEQGVQVIGGCCGFGPDYIRPLRAALPARIAAPRSSASVDP